MKNEYLRWLKLSLIEAIMAGNDADLFDLVHKILVHELADQ